MVFEIICYFTPDRESQVDIYLLLASVQYTLQMLCIRGVNVLHCNGTLY